MAKYITNEEFFNQLNSCEYGRQYIELVTNPKNHLGKKEKGDNHHVYMKAICGENSNLVRLSYYNHCLAHLLLAKAGCELDALWSFKALLVINRMDGKNQYNNLTDLEKADLELEGWAEAKEMANKKMSKFHKERFANMTDEEKEAFSKTVKEVNNRPEVKEKRSKSQKERFANMTDEEKAAFSKTIKEVNNKPEVKEKISLYQKERWSNMTDEERNNLIQKHIETNNRPEIKEKRSKSLKIRFTNRTDEELAAFKQKQKEAQNRPEVKEKRSKSEKERFANMTDEERAALSKTIKEVQNRPDVKAKISASNKGKNKGKIKIINENEPSFKMIFPVDLPYWESLGWHKKSA